MGGALTSRMAGWVVAAALAGALVPVSIGWATSPSSVVAVNRPLAGLGQVRVLPGGMKVAVPPGLCAAGPCALPARLIPGGPFAQVVPGGRVSVSVPPLATGPGPYGVTLTTPFGSVITGTVQSVSGSSFTLKAGTGRTVTVTEHSSTTYRKAGKLASASAVTRGARVAVLGSPSGSNVSASVVAVLP